MGPPADRGIHPCRGCVVRDGARPHPELKPHTPPKQVMSASLIAPMLLVGGAFEMTRSMLEGSETYQRLTVNGAELAYVEQGEGEPFIYVHGGVSDPTFLEPELCVFASRFPAIADSRPFAWPNQPIPGRHRGPESATCRRLGRAENEAGRGSCPSGRDLVGRQHLHAGDSPASRAGEVPSPPGARRVVRRRSHAAEAFRPSSDSAHSVAGFEVLP